MRTPTDTTDPRRDLLEDLRRTVENTARAIEAARRDPVATDLDHLEAALAMAQHELLIAEDAAEERAA